LSSNLLPEFQGALQYSEEDFFL